MRSNTLIIRMNDREKDMLDQLAENYQMSRAEVLRMLLTDRYNNVCGPSGV